MLPYLTISVSSGASLLPNFPEFVRQCQTSNSFIEVFYP
jgi:hypothetical protein